MSTVVHWAVSDPAAAAATAFFFSVLVGVIVYSFFADRQERRGDD